MSQRRERRAGDGLDACEREKARAQNFGTQPGFASRRAWYLPSSLDQMGFVRMMISPLLMLRLVPPAHPA